MFIKKMGCTSKIESLYTNVVLSHTHYDAYVRIEFVIDLNKWEKVKSGCTYDIVLTNYYSRWIFQPSLRMLKNFDGLLGHNNYQTIFESIPSNPT